MKIWILSTPSMAAFGWCFWTLSWLVKMKTMVKMQIKGPHQDTCMFFYTNQGKYERGGNCGKYVGYYWQRQLVGDQLWGRLCLTTHKEKWKLPKTIGCRNLWKIIFLQQMCSTISKLPFSTAAQPNFVICWNLYLICIWCTLYLARASKDNQVVRGPYRGDLVVISTQLHFSDCS